MITNLIIFSSIPGDNRTITFNPDNENQLTLIESKITFFHSKDSVNSGNHIRAFRLAVIQIKD